MAPVLALRLCLDLLAAGLLVFGLSYWWLGDTAHEAAGLAMFLLVSLHQLFNRRWYGRVAKARHNAPSLFNVGVTAILVATMVPLLVTSAMLATFLPDWVSPAAAGTARQVHVLAAYWAFVVVAVHLGPRWPMIMGIARRLSGITRPSRVRTGVLRLATAAIVACGVWSFSVLQLGIRLTNRVSLEWWNFDEGAVGFFGHCAAAAGLLVAAGHYAALLLRPRRSGSGTAVTQHVH